MRTVTIIAADGRRFAYPEAAGRSLGAYRGPGYAQAFREAVRADFPVRVWFPSGAGGALDDPWFVLGRSWAPGKPGVPFAAPAHVPAYSVEIVDDTAPGQVSRIALEAAHDWGAVWRPTLAPGVLRRPLWRDHKKLVADGLVPPHDAGLISGVMGQAPAGAPCMIKAMAPDGTRTGERGEIGILSDWGSRWIATGDANALAWLMLAAEEGAYYPAYLWDGETDALVDPASYPNAAVDGEGRFGSPKLPWRYGQGYLDGAHLPQAAYLAWLATGDAFHLLQMQAHILYCLLHHPPEGRDGARCIIRGSQPRQVGWELLLLANTALATAEAEARGPLPAFLLPASRFRERLAWNAEAFTAEQVKPPAPGDSAETIVARRFHSLDTRYEGVTGRTSLWMHDYAAMALLWKAREFPELRPFAGWLAEQTVARWTVMGSDGVGYGLNLLDPGGRPYADWRAAYAGSGKLPPADRAAMSLAAGADHHYFAAQMSVFAILDHPYYDEARQVLARSADRWIPDDKALARWPAGAVIVPPPIDPPVDPPDQPEEPPVMADTDTAKVDLVQIQETLAEMKTTLAEIKAGQAASPAGGVTPAQLDAALAPIKADLGSLKAAVGAT